MTEITEDEYCNKSPQKWHSWENGKCNHCGITEFRMTKGVELFLKLNPRLKDKHTIKCLYIQVYHGREPCDPHIDSICNCGCECHRGLS